jgi:hypothetical protein
MSRLNNLCKLQLEYEELIDRSDENTSTKEKNDILLKLCAKFDCSLKEYLYLSNCFLR